MNWFSSHPFLSSTVFALILVIFGASVVVQRSSTSPLQYQPSTWSGAGGISATPLQGANSNGAELPRPGTPSSVVPYRYISPFGTQSGGQTDTSGSNNDAGLSELEKILTKNSTKDTRISNADVSSAYDFIPNGMISVPDNSPHDTAAQAELRSYGNDIGGIIQSFEQSNPDQPSILKNFMEDQNNEAKIAAMKNLGAQMRNIATLMQQEDPIPKQMKAPNTDLLNHYEEIGKLLAAVPDAKGNENLYNAIIAYDEAAQRFVSSFVNFALIFQANGVVFSNDEAGSVFMFQQGTSL